MRGVYHEGGLLAGGSDSDEDNIFDQWKNILLRETLATSSIINVRTIKASTFFSKGRLAQLGTFIKNSKADVVFINTTLSIVQKRNLEIIFNNYLTENNERIRAYNIKSAMKLEGEATDTESNFSNIEQTTNHNQRKIKVLDRFNVILSIFALRAKSKVSQLQIELAYLKYVKSRLNRGGHASFGNLYKDFQGDFFK